MSIPRIGSVTEGGVWVDVIAAAIVQQEPTNGVLFIGPGKVVEKSMLDGAKRYVEAIKKYAPGDQKTVLQRGKTVVTRPADTATRKEQLRALGMTISE